MTSRPPRPPVTKISSISGVTTARRLAWDLIETLRKPSLTSARFITQLMYGAVLVKLGGGRTVSDKVLTEETTRA